MALSFSLTAENDNDSTVELDENGVLEDTFDLLTDDRQLFDEFFEYEEADEDNEDKELLYLIALEMFLQTGKNLMSKYNSIQKQAFFLLLLSIYY